MSKRIRIGLIGAGANTRLRHIPGLLAIEGVEIAAVCNRRPESTRAIASEFKVPRCYETWELLVADRDLDAVVIGTWPYLHCPITVAALQAGKHVLTEARLSMNAAEAHHMHTVAKQHPRLITQIVPSPFGLKGHEVMKQLIAAGYLGELREVRVCHFAPPLADPDAPLSWRQDAILSGFNMLTLGILHETLTRWVAAPVLVQAQVHAHFATRIDPSGVQRPVGTPDSVQVLAVLAGGARATYHFSGVTPFGQAATIQLFGSAGVLEYDLLADRIRGSQAPGKLADLAEIPIPADKARTWAVEADFIAAIRESRPIEFTTFEAGVAYMEFTEAVARSAESGEAIELPLREFMVAR